ncbi:F-box protein At4g09920-like [Rhododendron vialii]|uniref:F-box protein At4g09920-like n=1 Tax=Rhododendron vialii TaxID=182163 RepID=UPI00265E2D27|nr:F-box protein At4g09920-like [Rhododendron vialii]XP_058226178.1 F-box protein At4g09920-like [Rhododendron vialii]XP_058226179.1 F-box protein At4g09920-like [Rhododendron vialii]XP_058226180.1 F-box protein At4g09920-like [Rhododendron vialii]XP_058226181.1 F-box protein At4g09920-like [Rhododendron vialii]
MKNFVEEDRISQLPNDILVNILSLLNSVEAAGTCVLSKRWQYVWTHVTALNFYSPKKLRAIEKASKCVTYVRTDEYIDMVNRFIQLHQGSHITEFKVFFFMTGREFRCNVDEWFSVAIRKSVQRLDLNLGGSTLLGRRCERNTVGFTSVVPLPDEFYTLSNKVYSLIKSPYGLSCIQSLTELSLTCVNVTGELVEHFLSNCPLLLRLRVCFSRHLVNLKVAGPSLCLKFLEISRCPGLNILDIYAPNLAYLICLGLKRSTQVIVRHAPLLVDLAVERHGRFLNALPASYFSQLESLTLSFDFCRDTFAPPLLPEFTNLKNLTFAGLEDEEHSFLDWTSLIERSPFLRTFTLQLLSPKGIRRQIQNRPSEPEAVTLQIQSRHTERRLKCLEVVTFVGNIDFELLVYFCQHAVPLKTIIVDCRPPSLEQWQEFEENESSMELRNLKGQLPPQVKLVICP